MKLIFFVKLKLKYPPNLILAAQPVVVHDGAAGSCVRDLRVHEVELGLAA